MSADISDFSGPTIRMGRTGAVWTAVAGLLAMHAAMLAWIAYRCSPTIDEPAHLVAGISHWKFGRFDLYRVNPPLVRLVAALPMLLVEPKTDWSSFSEAPYARPEFTIGTTFANSNGFVIFWYFTLCRWMCIPLSLAGGWFCYCWARELWCRRATGGDGAPPGPASPNDGAGLVALVLWCFCPNILGNGALMTPDVAAAGLGVTAGYAFWRWLREPDWKRALLAGLALGLVELTKATWIVLFVLWPVLWLMWRLRQDPAAGRLIRAHEIGQSGAPSSIQDPRTPTVQVAAILLLGLYVLNLGYGFENSFRRLGHFRFISHALGGRAAHQTPGNRFAGTLLASVPVPLPANYLLGIDVQRYDFEVGKWSYLRGEQKFGGWWYYYLYAMAVKMPVGTLLLTALVPLLAAVRTIRRFAERATQPGRHPRRASAILDCVVVLAPAVTVVVLVSSQTGFSRYLRYVLPAFPFLYVWISQLAAAHLHPRPPKTGGDAGRWPRRLLGGQANLRRLVVIALLASTLSSLGTFPHSLSYFNELAGGAENGASHLLDANIDWGQDLLELKRWCDAHPEARPLHVAYFGRTNPTVAGIDRGRPGPPESHSLSAAGRLSDPADGWYAISLNELYGYKHDGGELDCYSAFRALRPAARVRHSIRVFCVRTATEMGEN